MPTYTCERCLKEFSQKSHYNKHLLTKKIGRNEPCPCGSGKKYKHCCGAL